MALLTLKDIGKIYVSEGNVAVGIRGVNLSFERGEFVAITGKSGSGKSTLLNVISGMDSYEEGEMYIEGSPTSHYMQPDWENYREKYISFIFQDYNIIESFTVLQNVELALMHIPDVRERRRRALELLERVGLKDFINSKGSKLSGGQKQRTVIARALAKDSPIILADEPTGNLDSRTSEEIVNLLYEVSRDKLLIMVTHNFEQVEHIATRHIRVFDGAVESDRTLTPVKTENVEKGTKKSKEGEKAQTTSETVEKSQIAETYENAQEAYEKAKETYEKPNPKKEKLKHLKNGFELGRTIVFAKPKLTAFLCMLLIIGTLSLFFITSSISDGLNLFKKYYMFSHIEGRVVIADEEGAPVSESTLKELATKYGATEYIRYDKLIDTNDDEPFYAYYAMDGEVNSISLSPRCEENYGKDVLGRYPQSESEVLLYLPISKQSTFGKSGIEIKELTIARGLTLSVVGIKYYYDNTKSPKMLFTHDGLLLATYANQLVTTSDLSSVVTIKPAAGTSDTNGVNYYFNYSYVIPSFSLADGMVYVDDGAFTSQTEKLNSNYEVDISFVTSYSKYNAATGKYESTTYNLAKDKSALTSTPPDNLGKAYDGYSYDFLGTSWSDNWIIKDGAVYVSTSIIKQAGEEVMANTYKQASLIFSSDKAAHSAASKIREEGYIAVTSDTTYEPNILTTLLNTLSALFSLIIWVAAVVFIAFFINLCTGKTIEAFRGDMAIMRSMGIPVDTIRASMYIRMCMVLIPAFVFLAVAAVVVFITPAINGLFEFLHAWQYVLIVLGMIWITFRVTRKQLKKLFNTSVKKSLKGGNGND